MFVTVQLTTPGGWVNADAGDFTEPVESGVQGMVQVAPTVFVPYGQIAAIEYSANDRSPRPEDIRVG